jgi:acyl-CoA thioester hydrolase
MGHMNVRFYLGKAHQGLASVGVMLGLGPGALAAMGAEFVVEDQHIRFLRELNAGADLSIDAGIAEIKGAGLTLFQEVLPLGASHVSATLVSRITLRELSTGKPVAFPDAALAKAGDLASDIPDYAASRTLSFDDPMAGADEADAIRSGHFPVSLATIRSDQVDISGHLYPDQFMGHISDGIGVLFGLLTKDLDEKMYERSETTGGAALEYRFQYVKRPRAGSVIKILSAPKAIMEKVYQLSHVMVDPETGDVLARANSVHIAFDLKTRKAILVPDLLRRGLESHLIHA